MDYQNPGFNLLTNRRSWYLLKLLDLYENIIYTDIDTIWLGDPRKYLKGNLDIWVQIAGVIDGAPYLDGFIPFICTGFIVLHSSEKTKKLMLEWNHETRKNQAVMQDQNVFQKVVFDRSIDFGVLPMKYFPCGRDYFELMSEESRKEVVLIHNNFIVGRDKKIQRFKEFSLWNTTSTLSMYIYISH